jgi:hypothetical protein
VSAAWLLLAGVLTAPPPTSPADGGLFDEPAPAPAPAPSGPSDIPIPATPGPGEAPPAEWTPSRIPPFMSAMERNAANRFTRVRLDASGVAVGRLQKALAPALADMKVDTDPTPLGETELYIGVTKKGGSPPRIIVITANGRAFFRDVITEAKDPETDIVLAIVSLIHRIEGGVRQPDKHHEPIPAVGKFPEPPSDVIVEQGALPATRGPSWTAGFGLAPEVAFGVWPAFGGALAGIGGTLDGRARGPKGGLIVAGGRLLARRGSDLSLVRMRFHVLGGYTWRPSKAEVELAAGGSFEPWFVRLDGSGTDPERGGNRGRPPLIGGLLRLAAGYLLHGRDVDVRLGGRLEVAGSFAPDDGVRVPGIVHVDGTGQRDAFHLGGVEVSLGLDLAAMWRVRGRKVATK